MSDAAKLSATPRTGEPPAVHAPEAVLLQIARELARELQPGRKAVERAGLDSSLDDDWGFDSLSRAELLLRVERGFATRLPEHLLGEAETLRDLVAALVEARAAPSVLPDVSRHAPAPEPAEPAPDIAATLTEVLEWHIQRHGDRVHIVLIEGDGGESTITYRQLGERAQAVAHGLVRRGLEPGERVAIMLPTSAAFFAPSSRALCWRRADADLSTGAPVANRGTSTPAGRHPAQCPYRDADRGATGLRRGATARPSSRKPAQHRDGRRARRRSAGRAIGSAARGKPRVGAIHVRKHRRSKGGRTDACQSAGQHPRHG